MDVPPTRLPRRAVDSGLVGRFGTLDPTTGGETHRYSLSGEWAKRWEVPRARPMHGGSSQVSICGPTSSTAPAMAARRVISSNRQGAGSGRFAVSHAMFDRWGGFDVEGSIGLQGRVDHLNPVGLYWTGGRQTQSTVRGTR